MVQLTKNPNANPPNHDPSAWWANAEKMVDLGHIAISTDREYIACIR
jgi:hypothetical protein